MEYNKECIDLTQIMRLYKNVFKRNRLNYIRGKWCQPKLLVKLSHTHTDTHTRMHIKLSDYRRLPRRL